MSEQVAVDEGRRGARDRRGRSGIPGVRPSQRQTPCTNAHEEGSPAGDRLLTRFTAMLSPVGAADVARTGASMR